jgi:hypothetical protein
MIGEYDQYRNRLGKQKVLGFGATYRKVSAGNEG